MALASAASADRERAQLADPQACLRTPGDLGAFQVLTVPRSAQPCAVTAPPTSAFGPKVPPKRVPRPISRGPHLSPFLHRPLE